VAALGVDPMEASARLLEYKVSRRRPWSGGATKWPVAMCDSSSATNQSSASRSLATGSAAPYAQPARPDSGDALPARWPPGQRSKVR
jgi:hypothetical protein